MKHLLVSFLLLSLVSGEYRTYDGTGNNQNRPTEGSANMRLLRYANTNNYFDGIKSMNGALPNPRSIINAVFLSDSVQPESTKALTDMTTYWGQFLDHDISFTPGFTTEDISIPIPTGDTYFDPNGLGDKRIIMRRAIYDNTTGVSSPREQLTTVSAWIDGSQVYGADAARAQALRNGTGGRLKVSAGNLPVINTDNLPMENFGASPTNQLFLLGDYKGNENPGLLSLHALFVREHNRLADQFALQNPTWDDEKLYQEARRWVIAFLQHITLSEYIPVTIGESLGSYSGYNPSLKGGMYTEFSSAAFRYGHSEVNTEFKRTTENGDNYPSFTLKDNFYSPNIFNLGLDPLLHGMAGQSQRQVDRYFATDLRNFLFGAPGSGGMDLIAINIQRGRDNGIPTFTQARQIFGLPFKASWSEITSDVATQNALRSVYTDVNQCDLYVCGLVEDHVGNANVGPTFAAIIKAQYNLLRNGDRFWYENGLFNSTEMLSIRQTTLSALILRNTGISYMQCFAMAQPDGCYLPFSEIPLTSAVPSQGSTTGVTVPIDFVINVAIKSTNHPFYGQGDTNFAFTVNGVEYAVINMTRGRTYRIRNDANSAHSLFLSRSSTGESSGSTICDFPYTSPSSCGVQDGGILTFTVPLSDAGFTSAPFVANTISYACFQHTYMGGVINLVNQDTTTGVMTTGVATTGSMTTGVSSNVQTITSQSTTGALTSGTSIGQSTTNSSNTDTPSETIEVESDCNNMIIPLLFIGFCLFG
eukprot:TRINITY_DN3142_c0_g1_i1.p1 TRINITY_DN3142_c0_g1~~TRINITY_DN3142_c0_g1_i1.p1  ORF type:complete len:758 (-),score=195.66 TRINITY_DN3142_c0_g1_i1:32-2305(-)